MKKSVSHIIFRNTFYNLITQGILIAVALWSLPIIVHGLSSDVFGLLSLFWAFVGYFTLLDFGISRANVKFLSEAIAKNQHHEIVKIVWSSLSLSFLIGVISGGIIIVATPFLVQNVFKLNGALTIEASRAFYIAGLGIPFMLIFGTLKGFQMAYQRFEIFNVFQVLTGIIQSFGSVVIIWLGYGIYEIVLLTIGLRVVLALIAFFIMPKFVPNVFSSIQLWDKIVLKKLLTFGGWLTISQVISPLFLYLDRFFIGMFLSLTAVAYYTVPQEVLTRLLILPMGLTTTLFPALSLQANIDREENKTGFLYFRSVKYLSIVMLPLVMVFILIAPEIIQLWMGKEFAHHSVIIFQILSVGLLFNSLAQVPSTTLQALGRPDLTAKFHIYELPLMIVLNLSLIPILGIIGAAIAWSSRVFIDAGLLFYATQKQINRSGWTVSTTKFDRKSVLPQLFLMILIVSVSLIQSFGIKVILLCVISCVYAISAWFYSFDEQDRKFILRMMPT